MRYLSVGEILELYRRMIDQMGGGFGVRDLSALLSSIAQPRMTFDETDLYPSVADKAAALGFSLVMNHPFLDGNKRTAHAAMEVLLNLNGYDLKAPVDEQERALLGLAAGMIQRDEFTTWVVDHVHPQ